MNFLKKSYKLFFLILFIISTTTFFYACKQDFVTNETPTGTPFPDSIATLFSTTYNSSANTCTNSSCHNTSSKAGGLDLQDWSSAMKGSNNGTMIIPYNAFWSHITSVVNNDTNISPVSQVLPDLHKMPSDKVAILMRWINNGAPNKDGQIANQDFTKKAFITNQAADLVSVVNTETNIVTRMIPVGGRTSLDSPHYIIVDPQQKYFYISLIQEGYVEKYDVNTYQLIGRIAAGVNPAHIVVSPDNNFIYVTNFEASGTTKRTLKISTAGGMSIVDTATAPQMTAPHGMAITKNGQYIFVTSQLGEYIFKINTSTMDVEIAKPVADGVPPSGNGTGTHRPYQCVLSPDDSTLYVTCVGIAGNTGKDYVRVFNANTLNPSATTPTILVGDNPLLMKYSRNYQYIFVCNRNDSTVTVINPTTNTPFKTITGVGVQPHGVDFSSDGTYAYIACETQAGQDGHHPTTGSYKVGVTRIINMSDLTVNSRKLEMGSFPAGISCIPY
ncbi:MAG: beta-propeller fold lactonase family protein [Bacteroidetes bacterium]|nr:beta-propeller fold lactonase family protein [Bacteroidota bacterium]